MVPGYEACGDSSHKQESDDKRHDGHRSLSSAAFVRIGVPRLNRDLTGTAESPGLIKKWSRHKRGCPSVWIGCALQCQQHLRCTGETLERILRKRSVDYEREGLRRAWSPFHDGNRLSILVLVHDRGGILTGERWKPSEALVSEAADGINIGSGSRIGPGALLR